MRTFDEIARDILINESRQRDVDIQRASLNKKLDFGLFVLLTLDNRNAEREVEEIERDIKINNSRQRNINIKRVILNDELCETPAQVA